VASGGARKAAMLLMGLDATSAAELLKSVRPEFIPEIAAELTCLQRDAQAGLQRAEPMKEFFTLLYGGGPSGGGYVRQMLEAAVGKQKSTEVLGQVHRLVEQRDPFGPIRSASAPDIAESLKGESSQVIALVLSELPGKTSSQLLALLPDEVRPEALRGMTAAIDVSPQARLKVASAIRLRLEELSRKNRASGRAEAASAGLSKRNQQLRKVAVLLRGLDKDFRNALVNSLSEHEKDVAATVQNLMVIWEDLPQVSDRTLQEVLRTVDNRKLALSLIKADEAANKKIRSNISERAGAMVDEEISLLSSPKAEEIEAARQLILDALRAANAKGELSFEET